jgi:putative addiction module component (TIGR02574 family)
MLCYAINMSTEEMIKAVISLSPLEKVKVIEAILQSMDRPDPKIEKLWNEEVESRIDALVAGRTKGVPLEENFP